jgi:hypothetical protein
MPSIRSILFTASYVVVAIAYGCLMAFTTDFSGGRVVITALLWPVILTVLALWWLKVINLDGFSSIASPNEVALSYFSLWS